MTAKLSALRNLDAIYTVEGEISKTRARMRVEKERPSLPFSFPPRALCHEPI